MDYQILRNLLASVMSVDVGLTEEREEVVLITFLQKPAYRNKLRNELEEALCDSNLSLVNLLDNERYCVFSADSEDEARNFLLERIWSKIVLFDSK